MIRALAARRPWETLLLVILVATVIYNAVRSQHYLGVGNFVNMFQLSIEKIVVAVVMTFLIINGEIDLSVASTMALAAATVAFLDDRGAMPFWLALLVALLAGAVVGLIQGACVAWLALPSLVVTLAGMIGVRGATRMLVEDRSIGGFPGWFTRLGQRNLLGPLPFALLAFFVLIAIGAVVLARTAFGRTVYVIGDNADVAVFSGIDVRRVKISLFVASGTVAAFAGLLYAARLGSVRGDMATGFELDIITIVLLGGVSIFGGKGSMTGVFLAILIVLNIRNGLGLNRIGGDIQTGVIGGVLITSVLARNAIEYAQRRWSLAAALAAQRQLADQPHPTDLSITTPTTTSPTTATVTTSTTPAIQSEALHHEGTTP